MKTLDNKYTKWYYNIIYKAKDIKIKNQTELHHILPKSLFPEYKNLKEHSWNGVNLTPEEKEIIAKNVLLLCVKHVGITMEQFANDVFRVWNPMASY